MIRSYYLFREQKSVDADSRYDVRYLQFREIRFIENVSDGFNFWEATRRIFDGDRCIALWVGGEIVSFAWVGFKKCNYLGTEIKLNPGEAFLYFAYTFPRHRGNSYAEILRHHIYEMVNADIFYSFTDANNRPALSFKKNIGAVKLKKYLYIKLWRFKYYKEYVTV